ncbi:hypothetical protein [Streptomyces sp. NPDC097619]|uniref:hypothetical protein n=1 Tax=Streptomyces sp. NPDC097619 TaxID=3157228 RepID=UPI0033182C47
MSAAAARRRLRRTAAAILRTRRAENRAHRIATGRVKVSDFLTHLGMPEEDIDRFGSWAGRHIAAAYRAATGGRDTPLRARKRTAAGKWVRVFVYRLADPALYTGARQYARTAAYLTA